MIKAIRSGVRVFSNRYQWTGSGAEQEPTPRSAGHTVSSVRRTGRWHEYFFDLGRPLAKGDEETVLLSQNFVDSEQTFDTFLAKDIIEALQSLTLDVTLPVNRIPAFAEAIEFESTIPGAAPIKKTALEIDIDSGSFGWEVARPRLGRRYEIRWKYADGLGLYGPPD